MPDTGKLNSPMVAPELWPGIAEEKLEFQGIPGVECTPGGTKYAVWYGGGAGEGPGNFVTLSRCTLQNPNEWSIWLRVVHPGAEIRCFDPCLWLDPVGYLHLFWAQSRSHQTWKDISDGTNGVWQSICTNPDAPDPSWSEPRRIGDGIMLNKPIVTSNGEWLLPVSIWNEGVGQGHLPEALREFAGANVYASVDGGTTFQRRGLVRVEKASTTFDEHMIIQRCDGSLWMLIRTLYGIAEAFSTDNGYTWSQPRPSQLKGPNSRFAIRRLKSGALLLINHKCKDPFSRIRKDLTAFLSDDDGATWLPGVMIDSREKVSYPDFTQQSDGTIVGIYDWDRRGKGEILLAEFTEADLRNGQLPHPPIVINSLR